MKIASAFSMQRDTMAEAVLFNHPDQPTCAYEDATSLLVIQIQRL